MEKQNLHHSIAHISCGNLSNEELKLINKIAETAYNKNIGCDACKAFTSKQVGNMYQCPHCGTLVP